MLANSAALAAARYVSVTLESLTYDVSQLR